MSSFRLLARLSTRCYQRNRTGWPMMTRLADRGEMSRLTGINHRRPESSLATLRKKTGYAFALCRKALEQNDDDLQRAEKWLKAEAAKQGWERAERVKSRQTGQGLIGIFNDPANQQATMVEVKCETDFVARNEHFIQLVSDLARSVAKANPDPATNSIEKRWINDEEKLRELCGNRIVESIQKLGENIRFLRACLIKANTGSDIRLIPYTHAVAGKIESNASDIHLGKYGTIVAVRKIGTTGTEPESEQLDPTEVSHDIEELGSRLGQHIIGLSPKTINRKEPPADSIDDNTNGDEEPTDLLRQRFIFNEDLTVESFIRNSRAQILDFVRFECGENDDE